jgi:casein kinase 1 alpha
VTNVYFYLFLCTFRILFRTLNHQYDYTFDWTMLKQRSLQQPGMAITHQGQPVLNEESDRRTKEKQPSETELK